MRFPRRQRSISHSIAAADSLARVGRYDEAISSLQALNHVRPDRSIEVRLVELRSEAFLRGATPPTRPVWPEAVADLFPGSVIPEINGREVTVDHVRSAIWNHGSLIVRGLVDPQRVAQLVGDIDAALAGYDAESAGTASDETSRWYRPIARDRMSDLEQKRFRGAVITRGSVLTVDSPRSLFDLIETFDETRLTSILHDYFGERPLLLARKCTLRRISPNGQNGGWHQDGAFMGAGIRSINVWIAVIDGRRLKPHEHEAPRCAGHRGSARAAARRPGGHRRAADQGHGARSRVLGARRPRRGSSTPRSSTCTRDRARSASKRCRAVRRDASSSSVIAPPRPPSPRTSRRCASPKMRGSCGEMSAAFLAAPAPREAPFDLVFADPPYSAPEDEVAAVVGALAGSGLLTPDARVVLERPTGAGGQPAARGLRATWERTFGDTLVVFLEALLRTLTGSLRWQPPSARAHSTR